MKILSKLLLVSVLAVALAGCSKEPVTITSVEIKTGMDRGSGNFNRVLNICFDKPLKSEYFHTMSLVTKEGYKLSGGSWLRPRASDPKNKCQLRNIYLYLGRDDPPGSRPLIDEYVRPGNISQLLIKIYEDEPKSKKERPMTERLFSDI